MTLSRLHIACSAFIVASFLFFAHSPVDAQSFLGPHLGINLDGEDIFIGGNGHFPVGSGGSTPIFINPRLDFYLRDNITLIGLNGNFYFQFGRETSDLRFHAGGGLGILYASANGVSDTDVRLNLLGGLKFSAAGIRWLTQAELSFIKGSDFEILFGPIFEI